MRMIISAALAVPLALGAVLPRSWWSDGPSGRHLLTFTRSVAWVSAKSPRNVITQARARQRRRQRRIIIAAGAVGVGAGWAAAGSGSPPRHRQRFRPHPGGAPTAAMTWSVVPSPNPGPGPAAHDLWGVSCVSATACMAVGSKDRGSLAESWNGTRWAVVPAPSPGPGHDVLEGVSCPSASACMAVGVNSNRTGSKLRALAESWNGTHWARVPTRSPGTGNELHSVSCTSARTCTAVGFYITSGGAVKTLAESWNGTHWAVVPSPNPGTTGSIRNLDGVSCISAAACTAVGNYFTSSNGPGRTLIESWNGIRWSVVPSPSRGNANYLLGVSCASASTCTAAGMTDNKFVGSKTLVESGTDTR
jgi:hypothetical protein